MDSKAFTIGKTHERAKGSKCEVRITKRTPQIIQQVSSWNPLKCINGIWPARFGTQGELPALTMLRTFKHMGTGKHSGKKERAHENNKRKRVKATNTLALRNPNICNFVEKGWRWWFTTYLGIFFMRIHDLHMDRPNHEESFILSFRVQHQNGIADLHCCFRQKSLRTTWIAFNGMERRENPSKPNLETIWNDEKKWRP